MSGSSDPNAYLAVGRQLQPFERFDSGYASEVGAEPQLSLRLITPPECPALDVIRLGTAEGASTPRIELTNYSVARLYELKGEIVSRGIAAVTGLKMPVFAKRRFQHGALPASALRERLPFREAEYRKHFLSLYS